MKKNNRTGSHLFFIEFLIVLFFFLIVSTVCLRMFARAHGITRRADALSHAQAAAASVAAAVEQVITDGSEETGAETTGQKAPSVSVTEETAPENGADAEIGTQNAGIEETGAKDSETALLRQAAEYLPDAFLTHLPDSPESQEGLAAAYDEEFQPCAIEDAYYLLTATLAADGQESGPQTASEEKQKDGQEDGQNDQENRLEGALETLHISVHDYHQNLIYELSASFHRPTTRKEALQ